MTDYLNFALLGVGNGAVFAALAVALVVCYRSSGVVNFATGALALHAAFTFAFLRRGELLVPLPPLPSTVDVGGPVPFALAMVIAILIEGLVGVALWLVVFRPLRRATPRGQSGGLARCGVVADGADRRTASARRRSSWRRSSPPDRPTSPATSRCPPTGSGWRSPSSPSRSRSPRCTASPASAWPPAPRRRPRSGALVSGISPERIALANWAISAMVAGTAGILIAPLVPLVPGTYTLFIVPALAAAVLGRFFAFLPAIIGGFAIGMLQSLAVYMQTKFSWFPSSGRRRADPADADPRRPRRARQTVADPRRPPRTDPRPRAASAPRRHPRAGRLGGGPRAARRAGRQLPVGADHHADHGADLAVARRRDRLLRADLARPDDLRRRRRVPARHASPSSWDLPFPIAPLLAAIGRRRRRRRHRPAGAAHPGAARRRGHAVARRHRRGAVVPQQRLQRRHRRRPVTGPTLFGLDLAGRARARLPPLRSSACSAWSMLVVVALLVARLRTSRLGSAMLAVRANERSAAAAGISVVRIKLIGFGIGAFIAGLGGCLLAYKQSNVSYESFSALPALAVFLDRLPGRHHLDRRRRGRRRDQRRRHRVHPRRPADRHSATGTRIVTGGRC